MTKPATILSFVLAGVVYQAAPLAAQAMPASVLLPRSRVVVAHNPSATTTFVPRPEVLLPMVEQGLAHLLEKSSAREAWFSLMTTQDIVGLKVFAAPGPTAGTRPAVVEAVVRSLIDAGLPPGQIVVWDKHEFDLRRAG
jgi:hypothetical protein